MRLITETTKTKECLTQVAQPIQNKVEKKKKKKKRAGNGPKPYPEAS